MKVGLFALIAVIVVAVVGVAMVANQPQGMMTIPVQYCPEDSRSYQYDYRAGGYEGCVPMYRKPIRKEYDAYNTDIFKFWPF